MWTNELFYYLRKTWSQDNTSVLKIAGYTRTACRIVFPHLVSFASCIMVFYMSSKRHPYHLYSIPCPLEVYWSCLITSSSKLVKHSFSLWIILVVNNVPHTYNHGVSLETVLLPPTVGILFLNVPYGCHYSLQISSHLIKNLVVLWLVKHCILLCNFKYWPLSNFNEKSLYHFFCFKIKKVPRRNTYLTCVRDYTCSFRGVLFQLPGQELNFMSKVCFQYRTKRLRILLSLIFKLYLLPCQL